MKPNREYRAMAMLNPTALDSEYRVEGYATTFDVPYLVGEYDGIKYYEMVDSRALDGADLSDVIMQYDHHGRVLARNANGTLEIRSDSYGLHVTADLSKSTAAREMYEEIKAGLVSKMSWAFVVQEDGYDRETHVRKITKIKKVYDVSAVSIPANADTDISARSWLDGVIELERTERFERRKKALDTIIKIELEGIA